MKDFLIRKKSKIHGLGTFTQKIIKKGDVFYEVSASLICDEDSGKCAYIGNNKYLCGENVMYYINHSCNPNATINTKGNPKIIAIQDIFPEEEITHNYEEICKEEYQIKCRCLSKKCRKIIGDINLLK
jgi:SET domain-containing protein